MARAADRAGRSSEQVTHRHGFTFVNADTGVGPDSLRVAGSRLAVLSDALSADDVVVDVRGDRILPGLINAHDHLQLNTIPRLEAANRWENVREWISDINVRRRTDPAFEACVAVARDERLLIGGVKNLLSGVTTVAHHDPLYPFLESASFPTGVVTSYGWSHSLYIDGEEKVRDAHRSTPPSWPWIIHAAEGVDEESAREFDRLEALGCIGPNTLIVHGVALDPDRSVRLQQAGAGLIWCPSSNLHLFGRTAHVNELVRHGRVALGTDSRLSGSRDMLCELNVARAAGGLDEATLESLVTRNAATLLRLSDRGSLTAGSRADLLFLPAGMPLSQATRADVRLVLLGGVALYADPDYAQVMAPMTHWAAVRVDGRPKMLARGLVSALAAASANEDDLDITDLTWRAA
jgi:cytosine/adenosine deaminase-related metal-dependent hydrolase